MTLYKKTCHTSEEGSKWLVKSLGSYFQYNCTTNAMNIKYSYTYSTATIQYIANPVQHHSCTIILNKVVLTNNKSDISSFGANWTSDTSSWPLAGHSTAEP